ATAGCARDSSARGSSAGRRPRARRSRSTGRRCDRLGRRRLARARGRARALAAPAAAAGRRARRRRERPGQRACRSAGRSASGRERAAALIRSERERRRGRDLRRLRARSESGRRSRAGRSPDPPRVPRHASPCRRRRPADALLRRVVAGLAPQLPHDRRHARPPHAAAPALSAPTPPARPLPARRPAGRAGPGGHHARRIPAPPPRDARRNRRLGRRLPHVLRGHRPQLPRGEGGLGALVRPRRCRPARLRRGDRQDVPVAPHDLAREGDVPLPAQASRAAARLAMTDKYAPQAEHWTETAYADPAGYLAHRAELVVSLGPRLEPGERVLDLACGDGGLAAFLPADYVGVDASPEMVAAARLRSVDAELADLNEYEPPEPVAATLCFRAIYYARDRRAFFEHVAGYTEKKFVFDPNPRQYRVGDVRADLEAAGFDRLE